MAMRPLPDGSIEVTDDTGVRPPVILPPQAAASLGPAAPLPPLSMASLPPAPAAAAALPPLPPTLAMGPAALANNGAGGVGNVAEGGATVPNVPGPEAPIYTPGPGDPLFEGSPGSSAAVQPGTVDPTGLIGGGPTAPMSGEPSAPSGQPLAPLANATSGLPMAGALAVAEATQSKPGGYSPGHPGGPVATGFQSQKGQPPLPPELREQVKNVYGQGFSDSLGTGTAIERSMLESEKNHLEASERLVGELANAREQQREREAAITQRIEAVEAHAARVKTDGTRDIVKEYWASDAAPSRLQVAMGAFGAALLGSTVNPVLQQANAEVNTAIEQQKMRLDSGNATTQDMLGAVAQMRATFTSPDAADAAAKALLYASLEQQALALSTSTANAETQGRYAELANQYSLAYTDWLTKAHAAESDRVAVSGKILQPRAGGYSAPTPATFGDTLKKLKKMGVRDDAAFAMAGQYFQKLAETKGDRRAALQSLGPSAQLLLEPPKDGAGMRASVERENFIKKSQVVFPDSQELLYGNPELSVKFQTQALALSRMTRSLDILDKMMEDSFLWKDLPTSEQAKYRTELENYAFDTKEAILKEAFAEGDRKATEYLRGQVGNSAWAFKPEAHANLAQLKSLVERRRENLKEGLYVDPELKQPYFARSQAPAGAEKVFESGGTVSP